MYGDYLQRIGWLVAEINGTKVFIRKFPLFGSLIKIQRPEKIPSLALIDKLVRKYRAWSVSIEYFTSGESFGHPRGGVAPAAHLGGVLGFKINNSPYLPTKTIRIDLTKSEGEIFKNFTEAKRRAVRRAIKNAVVVKESDAIEEFTKLKSKDFWPLGWFMVKDVRALWESFRPKNASVFIAYQGAHPVAGILLLIYDKVVYYWMAVSTNEGKKLFAPTLLVWQALKLAKKKRCKIFDFEGVYDERFHKATQKWQGFTKFKQGFGGKEVIFSEPLIKYYCRAF